MKVYRHMLPEQCCPLLRLEEALYIPRELIDLYLQPKFTVQEYNKGAEVNNSPLSHLASIVEVTEEAEPGTRIIVSASAGVGKSAFSSHSTRLWCHGQALNNCNMLYLLLPRYIHRHAESIERIISTDLKLHDISAEAELRRAMKNKAQNMMFTIDGYDEVSNRDQRCSSLNEVISGRVASEAKVVITTRPHCVDHLIKLCHGSYVLVSLEGLTTASSKKYIQKMCATEEDTEAREEAAHHIMSVIPEEARHVPLLLNMAVLLYKWNKKHPTESGELPRTRTVTDVIGRVIGMFIAIKTEKDEGRDTVPVYASPMDENIPRIQRKLIKQFASMCFEAIKRKDFVFTLQTLRNFDFIDGEELSQLGFLEIIKDSDGQVESARCVHNQLLEYCAAMHIAYEPDALAYLTDKFSAQNKSDIIISEALGFWQDTLIFAAGINPAILSTISSSTFSLQVTREHLGAKMQKSLDLSYEARLLHETECPEAREQFCQALMTAPIHLTRTRREVFLCLIK